MECRHERRTLTTGRQVARAEIGHGRNAGFLGNDRWIADLPGKGIWRVRPVANGLAVAADGANAGCADTNLASNA